MTPEADFDLVELFWSAQGEGPNVGRATVFLRFGGCDLRCAWCDSPGTWKPSRECRFESSPGSGVFEKALNPVSPRRLEAGITALSPRPGDFLSLTGGEPLLQPRGVIAASAMARKRGLVVALETHGLACDALAQVLGSVDYVSMDWKLRSDVRWAEETDAQGGGSTDFAERHRDFLALVMDGGVDASVKVVVTQNTQPEELDPICRVMAEIAPDVPLILQPVTPFGRVRAMPSAQTLLGHLRRCSDRLPDVRLIPQTHRAYGAL